MRQRLSDGTMRGSKPAYRLSGGSVLRRFACWICFFLIVEVVGARHQILKWVAERDHTLAWGPLTALIVVLGICVSLASTLFVMLFGGSRWADCKSSILAFSKESESPVGWLVARLASSPARRGFAEWRWFVRPPVMGEFWGAHFGLTDGSCERRDGCYAGPVFDRRLR